MPSKEDLLYSLTVRELRQLAKANGIPLVTEGLLWNTRATTKEEIVELLLESSKITKRKIHAVMKAPPNKGRQRVQKEAEAKPKPSEVKQVLIRIKRFKPFRRAKKEKELETMLVSNLRAFYPELRTQLTYERARIDAQIERIGIELKFQPNAGDFDRLYGQIDKYLRHLDYVIVVIGYEKSAEDTRFFKKRLKERGWLNRVFVVSTP